MNKTITVTVNGKAYERTVPIRLLLVDFIRDECGLTGTHIGCSYEGRCGACTVQIEGRAHKSCMKLAVQVDGKDVTTIEGLRQSETTCTTFAAGRSAAITRSSADFARAGS